MPHNSLLQFDHSNQVKSDCNKFVWYCINFDLIRCYEICPAVWLSIDICKCPFCCSFSYSFPNFIFELIISLQDYLLCESFIVGLNFGCKDALCFYQHSCWSTIISFQNALYSTVFIFRRHDEKNNLFLILNTLLCLLFGISKINKYNLLGCIIQSIIFA